MSVRVRSFKLRFHEAHVRVVPAGFDGPGVDVRGEAARELFRLAAPVTEWLLARQPSVTLRALSVDLVARRVLVSFEDAHAPATRDLRPMVLRIEPPESSEILERAAPLVARLAAVAAETIARRAR